MQKKFRVATKAAAAAKSVFVTLFAAQVAVVVFFAAQTLDANDFEMNKFKSAARTFPVRSDANQILF